MWAACFRRIAAGWLQRMTLQASAGPDAVALLPSESPLDRCPDLPPSSFSRAIEEFGTAKVFHHARPRSAFVSRVAVSSASPRHHRSPRTFDDIGRRLRIFSPRWPTLGAS